MEKILVLVMIGVQLLSSHGAVVVPLRVLHNWLRIRIRGKLYLQMIPLLLEK